MSRREWALLGAITLAGALIRFLTLGHQSYDHDEAVTAARVLQPGLGATLHVVAHGERSPPLYYVLAWIWSKPFGTGEVGLRSLSAVFGTLTIPLAYSVARQIGSSRIGLVAAALVATNPYLIWYSQEARSYALMVLFAALALVGFARSIRAPSKGSLGLWALASALALCSHYFAVFLVAPQAAWLIWVLRPRRPAIVATVAVGIAGLALAPYAASQEGSSRRNGFTNIPLATRAGETALDFVASEEPDPLAGTASIDAIQIGSAALAGMLFLLAAALALSGADDAERVGAIAIGSVALASIAVPLAFAAAGLDFITPRNLIGAVVPLVVVAAIGFGARPSGRVGLAAALGGLLLFCGVDAAVYASAQMQRPDWRGAAQAIGPARAPRILVVNHNGDDPLDYYLGSAKLTKRNAPKPGVREVVALGSGPPPRPPGSGFRLATERRIPPFTLTVFRASSRVRIARPALEHVLQERDSLLVQRPR